MIKSYSILLMIQIFLISYSSPIQEINNICNKIDIKHTSSRITTNDFLLNNNFDLKKENFYGKGKIYNFLLGTKLEEEYDIDYIQIIKKYLINKYIFIILLIWFIFLILFFLKKCLFKSDLNINLILKLSTFIIIIIFILIPIFCFIIIYKSNKLQYSINDASCNLLKFFYELNHGKIQESDIFTNKSDKWPGLFTLNSILLDTSEQIIKISHKEKETFSLIKEIKNDVEKYQNLINSLINLSKKGLPNPNINQHNEIFPVYLYELNNISKNNSLIHDINYEYNNYFLEPTNKLIHIYNYSSFLSHKSELYDLQLDEIFANISNYCYFIKDKSSKITNNIIIFQRHSEYILFTIRFTNYILVVFSIIIIILTILYYYKNLLWIKISFHISWNFSFLIIISFICDLYFIINLNEGAKDVIYLFQNDILKTNSNLFFDTCLNTIDSDLNTIFNVYKNDSALIEIDKYYKNILSVVNSLTNIETDFSKLKHLNNAKNEINKYLNNYELSTNSSYKENDISYILNNLSKLTSNSQEEKSNINCDSDDIWVSSKKECKEYKYITRYEIKDKFNRNKTEKYCFIIQDHYKEEDLKKIYSEICPSETYNQIINYILGLTKYYNNNENLLESFEKIIKDIERLHKKLPEIIVNQIKRCENDIGDLIDIYKPILGETNVTNLFKCERLKRKIINFYDISYNQIVINSKYFKIYIVIIILLGFLGILFIIINNHRNNKEIKRRRYMKLQNKDLNNDGVELIEEVPGEDEDN